MALVDRYIAAHKALRPRGVIWEVKPGSVTEREIRIEAEQLAEIHQSVDDLIKEADLRQVFHLLEEWENVFELPHTGTYEERLAALNAAGPISISDPASIQKSYPGFFRDYTSLGGNAHVSNVVLGN